MEIYRLKRFRFGLGLLILPLIMLWSSPPAHADTSAEPPVLTVSFPEGKGINERYEDGTYGGMAYDWLIEIAKYTGWKYEFVTGETSEMLSEMMEGKYDIMGGMFKQDALLSYFNYPDYIMGPNYALLIYSKSDPSIKGFDITTLNGRTIGVLRRATSKIQRLQKFLDFNNLSCPLVYFDDEESYLSCLDTNTADLMLGSETYMKDTYNVAARFEAEPTYLVTAKDKPELCEQMNAAIREIYSANPNFAAELYNKYFPSSYINSIDFTQADIDYIAQAPLIRVAAITRRHPLHYIENGRDLGILPEVLELITERSGLQFEYVYADTYNEAIKLVQSGKADLFGGFMDDSYAASELNLALTKSYATLDSVLLRNKRSTIPSESAVLALPEGRSLNRQQQEQILYYSDYKDCIKAIDAGKADYTELPFAYITDLYLDDYYANTTIMTADNLQTNLSMALSLPVNVPLYSVLSKAINNITAQEIENILNRNMMSASESSITLKSLLYTEPVAVISVCTGIVILIFGVFFLAFQFRMKNRMMQLKLEKAEETARTKSDILSRMSHEIRTPMNAIIGLTNLTQMSEEMPPGIRQNLEKINVSAKFLLSLINDVLDMSKINSNMMKINQDPFSMDDIASQMNDLFYAPAARQGLRLFVDCQLEHHCFTGDEVRLEQILTNLLSNAVKFTDPEGSVTLTIKELDCREGISRVHFSVADTGIGIAAEDLSRIFLSFEQSGDSRRHTQGTGLGLPISSNLVNLMGGELQVKSVLGKGTEFYFTLSLPVADRRFVRDSQPSRAPQPSLAGLRILLAEDNDLNAEIAISLLELQDITVERAENGQRAADSFAEHPAGYYDLILMDLQMPVMDGLSAAVKIRSLAREDAKTIPIIAMTANSFQEDRERAKASGMTDFISKPFEVDKLYEILSKAAAK